MTAHDHSTPASISASTSRRRMLATAAGLGGAALATTVAVAGEAAAADTGAGWLNVKDAAYGALGDNTADDQPAIQKAIDAAGQGGTVYFPPGRYKLGSPLKLSLGVTLRGDWNPHFPDRTFMVGSFLRPTYRNTDLGTGFDGDALIVIDPAPDASSTTDAYHKSAYQGGPRLYGLALRGCYDDQNLTVLNKAGTAITGVRVSPGVRDVGMDKVTIWRFTGDGLNAQNASGFQLNQVHCVANEGHGFTWGDSAGTGGGLVDADLFQCYSQANDLNGYDILNPNAVTMVDCRSEWNTQHGYSITGINYSMVLVGCNTDRNGQDGFHLSTSPGGRFLQLLGCLAKRDGKTATTASGFTITGTSAEGVVLTGCSTSVGRDDDNGGSYSPAYGITTSALNFASCVSVVGGEYVGTTAPFNDAGAVLVRHSGVTAGTQTATALTWDKSDVHMVSGAAGTVRDVQFWSRGKNRRWALRTTDTAESGTGDGSDFALIRYGDDGTALDTPVTVTRGTGRVSFTTPGVVVNANSSPGVNLLQSRAAGQGYAVTGADTASRAFQSQITGDAINRFAIEINGTQTFGPGGSAGRDTTWARLAPAQIGSPDSDIVAALAGKGLRVKEGTNAKMGTLTLNGATAVTVATTAVTATSRIFLTIQAPGGTPAGIAYVSARTAGTSFSVKGVAGDTSTVAWLIVEPA
ncbi:glycosyl hydrolase family 28-related protein [Streptomyces sp. NPDC050538]|uniref:glycosyl hydrolase family 28-related protein n=1 Tax=Streptomyces sp. NPDC050538 TaxID=3365627 RepID=UPI0037A84BFE